MELRDVELGIIAQIVNNKNLYYEHFNRIKADLFVTSTDARNLYLAFTTLIENDHKTDALSLAKTSKVPFNTVVEILTKTDYYTDFEALLEKLEDHYYRETLNTLSLQLQISLKKQEDIQDIITGIENTLIAMRSGGEISYVSMDKAVQELISVIDKNYSGNRITGIETGLTWLDNFTGGLQKSDLFVIAGRTSQGKTSLALTIAFNAARMSGCKVGIFSLEMSNVQLTSRLSAYATDLSAKRMLFERLTDQERNQFDEKIKRLLSCHIIINHKNTGKTQDIINQIRLMHLQHNIDVVIIDYLQLISTGERVNVEQDTAKTARMLKNIAGELGITVILLSQLSRSKTADYKPTLSDLRNSGQIEEAADIVLFTYRPEVYGIQEMDFENVVYQSDGNAFLEIAKGRNIGIGRTIVRFNNHTTEFSDYLQNITPTFNQNEAF